MNNLTLLIAIAACVFFTSCGNDTLSEKEAQDQIEKRIQKEDAWRKVIHLQAGSTSRNDELQREATKRFLRNCRKYAQVYVKDESNRNISFYVVQEAAKPYIVDSVHCYSEHCTHLKFCDDAITIISITEPAPNDDGKIVCEVRFKDTLIVNQFGKEIDLPEVTKHFAEERSAYFVKMQDGWNLEKLERTRE